MSEIDATTATRFISSLSKTLQSLCHGCLEFDSGIEIGGYIYVSVDKGNKIDYILDEVLQRNDQAMKFISNSYLSKKPKEISTRDVSCSPYLELQSDSSSTSTQNVSVNSQKQDADILSCLKKRPKKRSYTEVKSKDKKYVSGENNQNSSYASQDSLSNKATSLTLSSTTSSDTSKSHSIRFEPNFNEHNPGTSNLNVKKCKTIESSSTSSYTPLNIQNEPDDVEIIDDHDKNRQLCKKRELNVKRSKTQTCKESNFSLIVKSKQDDVKTSDYGFEIENVQLGTQNEHLPQYSTEACHLEPGNLSQPFTHTDSQINYYSPSRSANNSQKMPNTPLSSEQTLDSYDNSDLPTQFQQPDANLMPGIKSDCDLVEVDDEDVHLIFSNNGKCIFYIVNVIILCPTTSISGKYWVSFIINNEEISLEIT